MKRLLILTSALTIGAAPPAYDTIIKGGTIYDGSGGAPYVGDVAITGDHIAAVGRVTGGAKHVIDAHGLAVAPGFINMLSHVEESLFADPRAMSDVKQGVTLEVLGELSMGPLSPAMKAYNLKQQGDIRYPVDWTTLGGYFDTIKRRGLGVNVASFVGAGTVRANVVGLDDKTPDAAQLAEMQNEVRGAMNEGAMGVTTMLIYAPENYAKTPELIALAKASAACGGMYTAHMRSEGDRLLEAVDETIEIARASGGPAEIYHLKQTGKDNWAKIDPLIAKVEAARASGTRITADMYTYTAGATGLDAAMPTWVQAGGYDEWRKRLLDPAIRARVIAEMKQPGKDWENLRLATGSDEKVLLLGFKNPALKPLTGKTLAEVARMRGKSGEETVIDLVVEDGSRVGTGYFLMNEDNVKRQIALPWVAFGSDADAPATEGVFLKSSNHPRAYGNFVRLLGHYARDEKTLTLQEAVRRLTSFPAANLSIKDRGSLKIGYKADLAIFDPKTVGDTNSYAAPHKYAVGMRDVFVNGVQVLKDGEHTGAKPGEIVRGPGFNRCPVAKAV
jgi:N-acyl-D-amino-acid deacylase